MYVARQPTLLREEGELRKNMRRQNGITMGERSIAMLLRDDATHSTSWFRDSPILRGIMSMGQCKAGWPPNQ